MSLASLLGAPKRAATPPGDTPPRPAPDPAPPKRRRTGDRTAERLYFAELFTQLQQLGSTMTDLAAAFSGRQPVNKVMQVRTLVFPAGGVYPLDFHTAVGALQVTNLAAAVPASSTTTTVPTSNHPANPAAGAEVTVTVPAGETWTLQTLDLTLTTSATVATRQVQVIIDDGVNELWRILVTPTQAAGLATIYAFGGSTTDAAVRAGAGVNEVLSELPTITLAAGWRIRTSTIAIQAGDQYSAVTVGYLKSTTAAVAAAAHAITLTASPPTDAPPPQGVGVAVIPAGATHTINLASHAFTLYGTAGDQVLIQAFTAGAPPQAA